MLRLAAPLAVVAPGVYVLHLLRPSVRLIETVAVLVAALCLLHLVRRVLSTGPYDLPRLLPWRLVAWPWVRWRERIFLGWGRCWFGPTVWAMGRPQESAAAIGPTTFGKTAALLIPQALMWSGSMISTSTKPDVLRATAARRLELAQRHRGSIYVYAPTETGLVEGLEPIRWSPLAGCRDPRIVKLRVETMVATAATGKNVDNADHWRAGAGRILRAYFHAAAHHPTRPYDFAVVREWLARHEYREPLTILAGLGTDAGMLWATELAGVQQLQTSAAKEAASFFSAAETTVGATSEPAVLRSCSGVDIDPLEFLTTRSTLYVVSPSEHQEAVQPLLTGLIDWIVTTAYDLHRHGLLRTRPSWRQRAWQTVRKLVLRRKPAGHPSGLPVAGPLLLLLDEVANIAPLPALESILSQGGQQGVLVSWAAQSWAQLRHRWGEHQAEAIWSATLCKLVYGGSADGQALERLSTVIGHHRVKQPAETFREAGGGVRTRHHYEWRPRLSPSELRELKQWWALLLYREKKPLVVKTPLAARRLRMRKAMRRWPGTMAAPASLLPSAPPAAAEPHLHVVHDEAEAAAATAGQDD